MTRQPRRYQPTRPLPFPRAPPGAVPAQRRPAEYRPVPRNGYGITALILAVAGLVFGVVPFTGPLALLCGGLAVLFGLLGLGRARRGIASNATMSIVASILGGLAALLGAWGVVLTLQAVSQFGRDLDAQPRTTLPGRPGQIPGNGRFVVGTDIQPGTYRTRGPAELLCRWNAGDDFGTIITNEGNRGTTVTIDPTDGVFETTGCQPWTRVN